MLRFKDLREDHELTQQQCAEIAYISKNSYIRYEKGKRAVPSDVIIAFSKYYNVSADYLLGLIDYPRKLK